MLCTDLTYEERYRRTVISVCFRLPTGFEVNTSQSRKKGRTMKKVILTFLFALLLTMVPAMPAAAATPPAGGNTSAGVITACPAGTYRVRKHTRTKKKLLNTALATGVGAALGGGIGGGRGALIGAGTGAGGYLTYRYIRDRRGRCVRSYRRA
jgi:hypothetical protein